MGRMKNKRRREREAKQSRKLEAEWWYESNIEIEHVPEQLGEEEITPPIDNEYLVNNVLDNDDLYTEWYIRLSWDTCTEQLKQLKIARQNGGNSLTNAQSQYVIKKTELRNELETAVDTLTAPGTISKNKISGTSYNLSHGIFLNNLNNNDIQTIKTLGFNLIASTPARHTLESSIPAINADQAHDHGHRGQGRRLGVWDSNLDLQNNAFGCGPEEYSWLMDSSCGKVFGYNFRAMTVGYYRECEAGEHPDACDWCRDSSGLCDSWPDWYIYTICDCGQAGDPWEGLPWYSCTEDVIDNDCSSGHLIFPIGWNPGIGVEEYAYGLSDHGHHVSSIVGGLPAQDGSGTVGVAPDSKIVHFKGTQGQIQPLDVMAGVELALRLEDPPLDAINMSFGSKDIPMWCYDPNNDGNYADAKIIYSAELVNNAASANLLSVVSAGNSGPHGGVGKYWRSSVQPYGDFLYYYGSRGLLNDVLPGLDIYTWANNTTNNSNRKITRDWIGGGADCWIYWGLGHYFSIGVPGTAHKAITVANADTSRWNPEPLPTLYNGSSRGPTLPYVFTCGGIPPSAGGEECQKRCIGADYADVDDPNWVLPVEPEEVETTFGTPGSNTPLYAVELDDVDDVTWDNTMITGYENAEVDEEMFNAFIILSTQDTAELFCASKSQTYGAPLTYGSHTETDDTVEMLDTYLDHDPEYSVGLIMGEGDDWYSGCHWMKYISPVAADCEGGFDRRNFLYGGDYTHGIPNISKENWDAGNVSVQYRGAFEWDHTNPAPWGSGNVNTEYDDGTHSEDYDGHWVAWEQSFSNPGFLNNQCGVDDDVCSDGSDPDFWDLLGQPEEYQDIPGTWYGIDSNGNWRCCDDHSSRINWVDGDPGIQVECVSYWGSEICWNRKTNSITGVSLDHAGYTTKRYRVDPGHDTSPILDGTGCGSKPPCSHAKTIMNNSNVDGDTYVTTADFYNGYDDDAACGAFATDPDLGFCPTNNSDNAYDYCRYDAWKRDEGSGGDGGCAGFDYIYVTEAQCMASTEDNSYYRPIWIDISNYLPNPSWLHFPSDYGLDHACCVYPRVCLAQGLTDAQCDALEAAPCCKMSGSDCVGSQTLYPGSDSYDSAVQRPAGYDNSWYHLGHALESVTCVEDIVGEVGDLFYITGEQPCEMVGRGAFMDDGEYTWNRECDDLDYNLMHNNSDYDMASNAGLCSKGCWHYSEECGSLTGDKESVCSYVDQNSAGEPCDCQPVTEPVEIGGNPYGWADKPEIAAPGTNICAAGLIGWDGYEYDHNAWGWDTGCTPSVPDDCCYGTVKTGTSMAAPHVTGAVGVIKSVPHPNPDLSNEEVKNILINNATGMEIYGVPYEDYQVGSGLLNVAAATSIAYCYTVSNISGWNLVGLPAGVPEQHYSSIYPDSVPGTLYGFGGTYVQEAVPENGDGYWLYFDNEGESEICGIPVYDMTISLVSGWNLIAGISSTVNVAEIDDPGGIIVEGSVYGFNGTYESTETIEPGKGYWINASADGDITFLYQLDVCYIQVQNTVGGQWNDRPGYDCSDDMSNSNSWNTIAFRACCIENIMGECSTWVLMGHDSNFSDDGHIFYADGEWFTDLYSPCSGDVACATGPYNTEYEPEVFDCNCPCSTGIPQCPNGESWDPCHEEDASEGDLCFSYTPSFPSDAETIYYGCECD